MVYMIQRAKTISKPPSGKDQEWQAESCEGSQKDSRNERQTDKGRAVISYVQSKLLDEDSVEASTIDDAIRGSD